MENNARLQGNEGDKGEEGEGDDLNRVNLKCYWCNKQGHSITPCRKLKEFKEQKGKGKGEAGKGLGKAAGKGKTGEEKEEEKPNLKEDATPVVATTMSKTASARAKVSLEKHSA